MKKLILCLFLYTVILSGQEFIISDRWADNLTTDQRNADIYFNDKQSLVYYVAHARKMHVEPSAFNCLPVFSYTTKK